MPWRENLLQVLLAPRAARRGGSWRHCTVRPLPDGQLACAGLALIVHQLATKGRKYGARAAGGPPVPTASRADFGRSLIEPSVAGSAGGEMVQERAPEGLLVTPRVARDRLAA
jgi:hypothetical protein